MYQTSRVESGRCTLSMKVVYAVMFFKRRQLSSSYRPILRYGLDDL